MELLFFIVVIVVIVVLARRTDNVPQTTQTIDYDSMSYRQGYWDGVRACEAGQVNTAMAEQKLPEATAYDTDVDGTVIHFDQPVDDELFTKPATQDHYAVAAETVKGDSEITLFAHDQTAYETAEESAPLPWQHYQTQANETEQPAAHYDTQPWHPTEPTLSAEERRERSRKITINIALFAASILLVSGILLLSQSIGFSPMARFVLVWLLVAVFYAVGFIIAKKVPIIKPAALAFVGTALASGPFMGVVMYGLIKADPAVCWLVTSLLGMVMYVYASVRLNSKLLAYISLLSLFMVSWSLPAVARSSIAWYYIITIAIGSALSLLAHFKVSFVPKVFLAPVHSVAPFVVPVSLVASLVSFAAMSPLEYVGVFAVSAIYCATEALLAATQRVKTLYWVAARCLSIATAMAVGAGFYNSSLAAISYGLAAAGLVNACISISALAPRERTKATHHHIMVWVGLAGAVAATWLLPVAYNTGNAFVATVELSALIAVSFAGMLFLRRASLGWFAAYALTVLPLIVGMFVATPPFTAAQYIAVYVGVAMAIQLVRYYVLRRALRLHESLLVYIPLGLWMLMAAVAALAAREGLWHAVWWAALAAELYMVIVAEKTGKPAGFANGASLLALMVGLNAVHVPFDTMIVVSVWVHTLLTITGLWWLKAKKNAVAQAAYRSTLVAAPIYATVLGAIAFFLQNRWLGVAVWAAYAALLYAQAYIIRSANMLTWANAVAVVQVWLACGATGLAWLPAVTVTAWVSLVGLLAAAYWMVAQHRSVAAIKACWSVGTVAAVLFGLAALAVGIQATGNDEWLRLAVWLPAMVGLYVIAWLESSVGVLYGANTAIVVLLFLLAHLAKLTWPQTLMFTAWGALLLYFAAGLHARMHEWREPFERAMWRSGSVFGALLGALAVTILAPNGSVDAWWRLGVWLAVPAAAYVALYRRPTSAVAATLGNVGVVVALYLFTLVTTMPQFAGYAFVGGISLAAGMGMFVYLRGMRVSLDMQQAYWATGVTAAALFACIALLAGTRVSGADAWWRVLAFAFGVFAMYAAAYASRRMVMLIAGNAATVLLVALIAQAFGWKALPSLVAVIWLPSALFMVGSWLAKKAGLNERASTVMWQSASVTAVALGLSSVMFSPIAGSADAWWRLEAWLGVPAGLYILAWNLRHVWLTAVGNAAVVIALYDTAFAIGMPAHMRYAFVGWLSLALGMGAYVYARSFRTNQHIEREFWYTGVGAAVMYGVMAIIIPVTSPADESWRLAAWCAAAAASYIAAWLARSQAVLALANAAFTLALALLCVQLRLTPAQTMLAVAWVGIVGFYGGGRAYGYWRSSMRVWQVMFWSGVAAAGAGGLITAISVTGQFEQIFAAFALMFAGGALVFDDYERRRRRMTDVGGIVLTFGITQLLRAIWPDAHYLLYTHCWAILAVVLALRYRFASKRAGELTRLVIGLILITVPSFVAAMNEQNSLYQVLFLIEHSLMIVAGLLRAHRMATYWGTVGVVLAILYMLRGYTYLLNIVIGLLVIVAVVWVIVRSSKKSPPATNSH